MGIRTIPELYAADPLGISDEEMDSIISYQRELRAKALVAEDKGERAPRAKRLAPPPTLSLKDLKFK